MTFTQYSMGDEESTIVEFELSEDLIEAYSNNKDIGFLDLGLKKKIESLPVGTLLQVTKKIGSPIKIISAKEVDNALITSIVGE